MSNANPHQTQAAAPEAAPVDWLHLDHQLCFALYASSLAMTKLYKPLLAPLGLTYPQYLVMLVLWEAEGLAVSALGQRLGLDSGTLTPLLKRLEALALIERRRSTKDERRVDIFLTDEGRGLRARALSIPEQLACASACSLDELQTLTRQLQNLRSSVLNHLDPTDRTSAPG
ncbi:DNA-binding transcriptional regulator, MarR family [Roseateles sp. YR242]|uniref:MarR family winged helix-turn-helix transcriptional regulator n=1 Tax=Roseateles sp. YR242 TaxID=1855305 RepID=UPI0008BB71E2|nr:MarR family transcriptional regulator [Roseateles sp. YR242]SEL09048.1 DNA-binding transcriptional regulator, MarR family [Roseateles sp. YR242]